MKLFERILERPERNVGGGDFATRLIASVVLAALLVMLVPQLGLSLHVIKIALLSGAELGLVTLMLGLFLRTKTHFAGLQLLAAALCMLWLEGRQLVYPALAVGLGFLAIGAVNLVTRRSRVNQVLNVGSIVEVVSKPAAAGNGVAQ